MSAISTGRDWHSASIRRPMPRSRPATAKFRSESTIGFRKEGLLLLRGGDVRELTAASYPHIRCGGPLRWR